MAYPMYKLVALKRCVVRMYAILSIALMVPLTQQSVFRHLKCGMVGVLLIAAAAPWASTVKHDPVSYLSLPFKPAVWTLPVNPQFAASKSLLRCACVLIVIPISCLLGCFGGKRVVLAHLSALTIWTLCTICTFGHRCHPDMRAACWTVGTCPQNLSAAFWCNFDTAKQSVVVSVPLLLQMGLQFTDVWRVWPKGLVMLLCRLCCTDAAKVHKPCSKVSQQTGCTSQTDVVCSRHVFRASSLTCLSLTFCLRRQAQAASGMT